MNFHHVPNAWQVAVNAAIAFIALITRKKKGAISASTVNHALVAPHVLVATVPSTQNVLIAHSACLA